MSQEIIRMLAIAPVSRGFGLVVMDSIGTPLDWRVKEIHERPKRKNARCVFEVDRLIEEHRPQVLVLEDHRAPGSKKRKRVSELLDALTELAIDSGVGVAKYGPRHVRLSLGLAPSANKDKVAAEVAKRLPALKKRVPKLRRLWDSERYAMSVFVAASLALTHHSCAQRKDGPRQ
jgi:Holliday junction resolvasome RuvABC endonuclease subunit